MRWFLKPLKSVSPPPSTASCLYGHHRAVGVNTIIMTTSAQLNGWLTHLHVLFYFGPGLSEGYSDECKIVYLQIQIVYLLCANMPRNLKYNNITAPLSIRIMNWDWNTDMTSVGMIGLCASAQAGKRRAVNRSLWIRTRLSGCVYLGGAWHIDWWVSGFTLSFPSALRGTHC